MNSALDPQRHKGVDALNAKVGRLLQQLRSEREHAHMCERVREVVQLCNYCNYCNCATAASVQLLQPLSN